MEQKKIQKLQFLEQNLQTVAMQRQSFEMDFDENISAINEIGETKGPIYKIVGQLMISSPKDKILKELKEKEKLIKMRIKMLGDQESILQKQLQEIKSEFLNSLEKNNSN